MTEPFLLSMWRLVSNEPYLQGVVMSAISLVAIPNGIFSSFLFARYRGINQQNLVCKALSHGDRRWVAL